MNKLILLGLFISLIFIGNVKAVNVYSNPSSFNHTFYLYERTVNNLTQSVKFDIKLQNNDNVTYEDIKFMSNYTKSWNPEGYMIHPVHGANYSMDFTIEIENFN